jgi:type IVB pilus formation R64 PilN family outer membrane protein
MLKHWIALILSSAVMLVACHSPVYNQAQGNIADVKLRQEALRKKQDADARGPAPLLVRQGAYVDMTPISVSGQPSWLRNHIVIRGDQLPFSYYSRTIAAGADKNILTKFQVGLDPAQTVSISYSGTVKGALDLLASKSGYVYSVMGNVVYWQAFVTRTFDVAFMPGATDYLLGKASGGAGTTGSSGGGSSSAGAASYSTADNSASEYSSISAKLSVWEDIEASIKQMLSPDGRVTVSQATTTIIVRDRPTNVNLVAQYMVNINKNLSRQALVKVQILEVSLSNNFNFGINWGLIARAFNKTPFVLNGNYGTPIILQQTLAGAAIPTGGLNAAANPAIDGGPGGIPSYTVLLNALNQQGKTSLVSEPRVVCMNNQVSVIRIVTQEGYAASVQNTSTGGGGTTTAAQNTVTSQITPGSVTTGVTIYLLPKIMRDRIYLQVTADLSINNGFQNFSPGQTTNNPTQASIQLPNITAKHFSQRSMIRSGDTLIMAGFRQLGNRANAMQFLRSQALGGKASQETNTETIILITPIVLDDPA